MAAPVGPRSPSGTARPRRPAADRRQPRSRAFAGRASRSRDGPRCGRHRTPLSGRDPRVRWNALPGGGAGCAPAITGGRTGCPTSRPARKLPAAVRGAAEEVAMKWIPLFECRRCADRGCGAHNPDRVSPDVHLRCRSDRHADGHGGRDLPGQRYDGVELQLDVPGERPVDHRSDPTPIRRGRPAAAMGASSSPPRRTPALQGAPGPRPSPQRRSRSTRREPAAPDARSRSHRPN